MLVIPFCKKVIASADCLGGELTGYSSRDEEKNGPLYQFL